MEVKRVAKHANQIEWPKSSNDLPVLTWDECEARVTFFAGVGTMSTADPRSPCLRNIAVQTACKTRQLVVIGGFIHDVSTFIDEHPGGAHFIKSRLGRDATTAFFGGVYAHSNGANSLLSEYRVGVIEGGYEVEASKRCVHHTFSSLASCSDKPAYVRSYSEIIENLRLSGGSGVEGKVNDQHVVKRRFIPITSKALHSEQQLGAPSSPPRFDVNRLTGGLA